MEQNKKIFEGLQKLQREIDETFKNLEALPYIISTFRLDSRDVEIIFWRELNDDALDFLLETLEEDFSDLVRVLGKPTSNWHDFLLRPDLTPSPSVFFEGLTNGEFDTPICSASLALKLNLDHAGVHNLRARLAELNERVQEWINTAPRECLEEAHACIRVSEIKDSMKGVKNGTK